MIGVAVVAAPWGPIHVAADEDAVVGLEVLSTGDGFRVGLRRRLGQPVVGPDEPLPRPLRRRLDGVVEAILEHLQGGPAAFDGVSIELGPMSRWDRLVLETVRRVTWGDVASYGAVARDIGRPGAARAVGAAVGRNPIGLVIPCHRIIASDGTLGGYGGSWGGDREVLLSIKRELLAVEGSFPR